jgi:signal transduction histidine kinase
VSRRGSGLLPPAAALAAGLAGSVVVAALVGIPPRDLVVVLGLGAVGALTVAVVGLALQALLRRRRSTTATQDAIAAAVTAAAAAAAIGAVSGSMLLSQHDLAVVLAALPVAAGAGVAYGLLGARRTARDLEALAATAARLEAGDLAARAPLGGTAEVAAVAAALNTAAARLAEALGRERAVEASRRDLIAWASHDLRTPLTSLRVIAEALADDVVPDEVTRGRYLASLSGHVERLTRLVDDLFELAQIDAGALQLQIEPTTLRDLVGEVLERFEPEAAAAGVRLLADLQAVASPVLVGHDQIGRVLANLVVNAIRHTPAGGRVLVVARQTADTAEVQVVDGCGGIPEPDLPRVFERLWRGDPARTTNGAGLGLAIARGLVEAHGGTVAVANLDGGCRFTVRLPTRAGVGMPRSPT